MLKLIGLVFGIMCVVAGFSALISGHLASCFLLFVLCWLLTKVLR